MGFPVLAKGVRSDSSETAPTTDFPVPRDLKGVRSSFYVLEATVAVLSHLVIKGLCMEAEPHRRLLAANTQLRWPTEQEKLPLISSVPR